MRRRSIRVVVRLTEEEADMLDNIKHEGMTRASAIRILVHNCFERLASEACEGNYVSASTKDGLVN
jgi:hypothetical protein